MCSSIEIAAQPEMIWENITNVIRLNYIVYPEMSYIRIVIILIYAIIATRI
jgi:hypothetical protein